MLKLHLIDTNALVVEALRRSFSERPDVDVRHGNLLEIAFDTVVSPANSHGFMDGGIDAAFRVAFGAHFDTEVQDRILLLPDGLPVGAAFAHNVRHPTIRRVVVAPTMEFPESVPALNARRALAAALRCASSIGVEDLFCPGLCTGVGLVTPEDASAQMLAAFLRWSDGT